MIREHQTLFRQGMAIADAVIVFICFILAYQIRYFAELHNWFPGLEWRPLLSIEVYFRLLPALIFPWIVALYFAGGYHAFRHREFKEILFLIIKAGIFALMIFSCITFVMRLHFVSRGLIAANFTLVTGFLFLERLIAMVILHYIQRKGFNARHMLMVGTGPRAVALMDKIHHHPEWGLKIHGIIDDEPELIGKDIDGYKVLGVLEDIPKILEDNVIDEIVFVVPRDWLGKIEDAVFYCEKLGMKVSVAVDLYTLQIAQSHQSTFHGVPILTFQSTPTKIGQLAIKRTLDIIISGIAMIILSPCFIFVALLIKSSSKGPALFHQIRCSLNGRKFTLFKFRTMVIDAEQRLEKLRHKNEMSGPAFKIKDDPRIIRFGKMLRKFSIDEFPQLWNVFRGDMSIVGPRPPIPAEVKKYETWQKRRLSMRPGLTCLWQVQGRSKITKFDEWMRLDLQYIDNWSLLLDLKLFFKTIPIVLFGIGAK